MNKLKKHFQAVFSVLLLLFPIFSFASLHSTGTIIPNFTCNYENYQKTTQYKVAEVKKFCKTIEDTTWFVLYEVMPNEKLVYRGRVKSGSSLSLVPLMGKTTNDNPLKIMDLLKPCS